MILCDTSVWVDHLRARNAQLVRLLESTEVLAHPAVIGELALGNLAQRHDVLTLLDQLPSVVRATDAEVRTLIEHHQLHGRGIGWVDAHLLASTVLSPGTRLWTLDKRLHALAAALDVAAR